MIRAHGMQKLNEDLYPVPYTSTSIHMYIPTEIHVHTNRFTCTSIYQKLHIYVPTDDVNDKSTAS